MVVPAFTGLGAPHWDPYARGIIIGVSGATNKYHVIRATIESLAYQTADVVALMEKSVDMRIPRLKVDGGASSNNLLLEFQANILGSTIERPECVETTALGAAYLCGLALGIYNSLDDIRSNDKPDSIISPTENEKWRGEHLKRWHRAVDRSLGWAE